MLQRLRAVAHENRIRTTTWHVLLEAWRAGRAANKIYSELNRPSSMEMLLDWDWPMEGDYFVTTDKGLFRANKKGLFKVSSVSGFGIAFCGDRVIQTTATAKDAIILSGHRDALFDSGKSFDWREIYRIPLHSASGRVHQIGTTGNALWLANTARNSLTKIDGLTGRWLAEISPFVCEYGHPIVVDHNHLNGVFPTPNYLMFTAFRINKNAAFGLVGDGMVRLFRHQNAGIHDCFFAGNRLFFSDSSRWFEDFSGGIPMINARGLDPDYFDSKPSFIRGMAGTRSGELLAGNSFIGNREQRFSGQGSFILMKDGRVIKETAAPAAQIYDIVHVSGEHFDEPAGPESFQDATAVLEGIFGQAIAELQLTDVMVSENGKKFDHRDQGEISEYS